MPPRQSRTDRLKGFVDKAFCHGETTGINPSGVSTSAATSASLQSRKLREYAYAHGVGVTQTAFTSPVYSVTTSAQPKLTSTVRGAGEDAPEIPERLSAQMSGTPARPDKTVPEMLRAMDRPWTFEGVVRERFRGSLAEKRALSSQLTTIQQAAQLRHVEIAQLAKVLAIALPNAVQASDALQGLGKMSLVNDIRQPKADVTPQIQLAWRLAVELGSVPGVGLDLLGKVTDIPLDAGDTTRRSEMKPAERRVARAYLRAAAEVARSGPDDRRVDPGAIYSRGNVSEAIAVVRREQGRADAWPGRAGSATPASIRLTLSEKALLAIPDTLDPTVTERNGCEFAIHMVRAGMLTDARRNADGSLSEYYKVESRAAKTSGVHLDRALNTGNDNPLKSILKRYLLHKGKSPFFAHDTLISPQGRNMGFGLSYRGGTHDGRAIKDMIEVLEQALLKTTRPQAGPLFDAEGRVDAQLLDDATLRNLVRLAMLKTAKTKVVLLPRYARGDELPAQMLHAARDAAISMVRQSADADETVAKALAQRVEEMLQRENVRLTPTALLDWATAAGGPASEAELADCRGRPSQEGQPDWSLFAQGYGRSTGREPPTVQTPAIKGSTREAVAGMLADMVCEEELGSGFSLGNLGTSHFTTRGVSEVLTALGSKGTAALRLDVGGGAKRMVTFESGISADRSYLRMGVATVKAGQVGIGGSIGPTLGSTDSAKFSLSVGADLQQSIELLHHEGAVFCFPRHLTGGAGGDRATSEKKSQLLRLLIEVAGRGPSESSLPRPGNPEDTNSLVKAAYQAFGDIVSVGGFEIKQTDHRTTGGVSVGIGVAAGEFSAGLPAVKNSGQMKVGSIEYKDTSGTLRVTKKTESVIFKATADATLASFSAVIPSGTNDPRAFTEAVASGVRPPLQSFTALGIGPVAGVAADYFKCGKTEAVNRTLDEDEQLSTSYAISTFNDTASFIHALAADYKTFAEDKAKKYFAADYEADPQAAVARETRLLGEYAGKVLSDRDRTALPQLYWEFGDDVSAVNRLQAEVYLSRQLGDERRATAAEHQIEAMHKDPAWREARFASSLNVRSASEAVGLNGVLGLTHNVENRVSEQVLGYT